MRKMKKIPSNIWDSLKFLVLLMFIINVCFSRVNCKLNDDLEYINIENNDSPIKLLTDLEKTSIPEKVMYIENGFNYSIYSEKNPYTKSGMQLSKEPIKKYLNNKGYLLGNLKEVENPTKEIIAFSANKDTQTENSNSNFNIIRDSNDLIFLSNNEYIEEHNFNTKYKGYEPMENKIVDDFYINNLTANLKNNHKVDPNINEFYNGQENSILRSAKEVLVPNLKAETASKINNNENNNNNNNINNFKSNSLTSNSFAQESDLVKCEKKILKLIYLLQNKGPFTDENESYRSILNFSGRNLGDLGDYYYCTHMSDAIYFTTLVSVSGISFVYGVCFFKECDLNQLNILLPRIAEYASELLKIKINPNEITLIDVDSYSSTQKNDHKVGGIITVTIMFLIICLYILNAVLLKKETGIKDTTKNDQETQGGDLGKVKSPLKASIASSGKRRRYIKEELRLNLKETDKKKSYASDGEEGGINNKHEDSSLMILETPKQMNNSAIFSPKEGQKKDHWERITKKNGNHKKRKRERENDQLLNDKGKKKAGKTAKTSSSEDYEDDDKHFNSKIPKKKLTGEVLAHRESRGKMITQKRKLSNTKNKLDTSKSTSKSQINLNESKNNNNNKSLLSSKKEYTENIINKINYTSTEPLATSNSNADSTQGLNFNFSKMHPQKQPNNNALHQDHGIDGEDIYKKSNHNPLKAKLLIQENDKENIYNTTETAKKNQRKKTVQQEAEVKTSIKKPKKKVLEYFLSHFDFYEQLSKIFIVKAKANDPLRIFDGIRFFSAGWVVFGHGFYIFNIIGFSNLQDMYPIVQSWLGSILYSALFAVDVFFYMSAFMFYLGMQKYIAKPETTQDVDNVNKDYWSTSDYNKIKGGALIYPALKNNSDLVGSREVTIDAKGTEFNASNLSKNMMNTRLSNEFSNSRNNYNNNINNASSSNNNDLHQQNTKLSVTNEIISPPSYPPTNVAVKPKEKKTNKVVVFFMALLARYIRLLPLYLFVIFGITSLMPLFTFGTLDYLNNILNRTCPTHWWHNLLYFNNIPNYESPDAMCAGHTWYLANDMQFFLVFMLIFVFLAEFHLIRNMSVLALMLASLGISIWLCISDELNYNDASHKRKVNSNEMNEYYVKPYIRVAPYIMGLFFCEFYLESKAYPKYVEHKDPKKINVFRKINMFLENSNIWSFVVFIFGLLLINYSVFATYLTNNYDISLPIQGIMKTFNKVLFVLGLAILVQLTFLGKFKIIYHILSLDIFNIVSKLTFGIYLVHMYIIFVAGTHFNTLPYLNFWLFTLFAIGAFTMATMASLIVSLLFESPVISILKNLMGRE